MVCIHSTFEVILFALQIPIDSLPFSVPSSSIINHTSFRPSPYVLYTSFSGTIVSIDLDPREVVASNHSGGYRVVRLEFPPTRVVIFLPSAYDAGLHIPPLNRGEIPVVPVGVETRSFEVTGLHDRIYTFKRAQLPLLPGHLSSVYRAQVSLFHLLLLSYTPLRALPLVSPVFRSSAVAFRVYSSFFHPRGKQF